MTSPVSIERREAEASALPWATPPLRRVDAGDDALLWELYRASRAREVSAWGWGDREVDAFLRMQWPIERAARAMHHPSAECSIVLDPIDGKPVGRLLVDRSGSPILVVDIALLPAARGRGIGGALLVDILAEASRRGVPVALAVEHGNPAERLYTRLGFAPSGQDAARTYMTFTPRTATACTTAGASAPSSALST